MIIIRDEAADFLGDETRVQTFQVRAQNESEESGLNGGNTDAEGEPLIFEVHCDDELHCDSDWGIQQVQLYLWDHFGEGTGIASWSRID